MDSGGGVRRSERGPRRYRERQTQRPCRRDRGRRVVAGLRVHRQFPHSSDSALDDRENAGTGVRTPEDGSTEVRTPQPIPFRRRDTPPSPARVRFRSDDTRSIPARSAPASRGYIVRRASPIPYWTTFSSRIINHATFYYVYRSDENARRGSIPIDVSARTSYGPEPPSSNRSSG